MENNHRTAPNFLHKGQGKSTHFQAQMSKVYEAFRKRPKTMLMVSFETGILRANICRYVAMWRKSNQIEFVKHGFCEVSKHRAGYYTTNPDLFPIVKPSKTEKL